MTVFLIKLCHVCEWEYVRSESCRIFRHICYLHTDSHSLYLVLLSVQQWSIKFIEVDIPNIIAERGVCCSIFGELNFTLDWKAYVTVFSVDKQAVRTPWSILMGTQAVMCYLACFHPQCLGCWYICQQWTVWMWEQFDVHAVFSNYFTHFCWIDTLAWGMYVLLLGTWNWCVETFFLFSGVFI